jgi:hypothetical protein
MPKQKLVVKLDQLNTKISNFIQFINEHLDHLEKLNFEINEDNQFLYITLLEKIRACTIEKKKLIVVSGDHMRIKYDF